MLSLKKFLDHYTDVLFIIKDADGKILYPTEQQALQKVKAILNSKCNENGFYMYKDEFYDISEKVFIEEDSLYSVESINNVTKYEQENIAALTDLVTNLDGKRLTYEKFNAFLSSAIALQRPFACVMADADLFKNINDTYGHECGDEMLKFLGMMLRKHTRHKTLNGNHVYLGQDVVGRIGGEEFLMLLNDVSFISAYNIISKIRKEIETSIIQYEDKIIHSCTMSFGIFYVDENTLSKYKEEDDINIEKLRDEMIKNSDKALYASKQNGRNRISIYGIDTEEELKTALFTKRKSSR